MSVTDDSVSISDGRPLDTAGEEGRTALYGDPRIAGLLEAILTELKTANYMLMEFIDK